MISSTQNLRKPRKEKNICPSPGLVWLIHSFMYSFSQMLNKIYPSASYVPGSGPGAEHTDMNRTESPPSTCSVSRKLSSFSKSKLFLKPLLLSTFSYTKNWASPQIPSVIMGLNGKQEENIIVMSRKQADGKNSFKVAMYRAENTDKTLRYTTFDIVH